MPSITLPVVYSQWDSRWSNLLLGFNTQLPYNFYNFACLICCLAMVAQYYGKDWNPIKINEDLKKMGAGLGFAAGSGNYIPGGFNRLFGDITETRTLTPSRMTDQQIGEIKSSIDAGHPVMIQIDVNPRTVQNDTHFVLITGYNPGEENDFTIADPLGGKIRSLKDYLGWFFPNARDTIFQYTRYTGKKPAAQPDMILVGKDQWELMRLNHDKWHQIVNYFDSTINPNTTPFDHIRNIVGGIKSRSTDFENKLNTATGELALRDTEIANRKEQVSRLESQLLDMEKNYEARLKALKDSMPNTDELKGLYEGQLKAQLEQINEAKKEIGTLKLEITALKAGNQSTDALVRAVQAIVDFFKDKIKL